MKIEIVQGNIADQSDMEAIVNAANRNLLKGGGVCGIIHRAAGPELEEACRPLAPVEVGGAVITKGFGLVNPFVIHCVGPRYHIDRPEDELLAQCFRNAIRLCELNEIESVAFPAISTGIYNYPMREAARVSLLALMGEATRKGRIREKNAAAAEAIYPSRARIVLYSGEDHSVWADMWAVLRVNSGEM